MMEEKLFQDFKTALKTGNTIKRDTIQQIRASVLLAKKNNSELSDRDIEDIIMKERSKRLEAIMQFEKAQRADLVEKTNKELLYINEYLPQMMTDVELADGVKTILAREGVTEVKFLGYIIKKCKEEFGNRATGARISAEVKKQMGV